MTTRTKWLRPCLQYGLAALIAKSVVAGTKIVGSEWDDIRREMYAFHGIHPDIDEKVMVPVTEMAVATGPASPSSTDVTRNELPTTGVSHLRHRKERRIQSSNTGCSGIYCFSASFRGRFGASSFDTDQLKLPGKKGACYTLDKNVETAFDRIKFLDPSWNYSWSCKVRKTRSVLHAPALRSTRQEEVSSLSMLFGRASGRWSSSSRVTLNSSP
jgi:hypothetical protein